MASEPRQESHNPSTLSEHQVPEAVLPRPHLTTQQYVLVAVILAVITLIEVGAYYLDIGRAALTAILLFLSISKFAGVALYYMHLKFDHIIFSAFFLVGLLIAGGVLVSLLIMFDRLYGLG